jgi:hypothetical protein
MEKINKTYYADKELKPYIDEFLKLSKDKYLTIKNHTIFGTLGYNNPKDKSDTVGLCEFVIRKVTIDTKYWKGLSEIRKKALVFHELGHCTLFRGHTSTKWDDGSIEYKIEKFLFWIGFFEDKGYLDDNCPASLMHPYTLSDHCLKNHWDYYIEELFSKNKFRQANESVGNTLQLFNQKIEQEGECPETIIENQSEEPWNSHDDAQLKFVKENDRCLENTGLKCLKKFIKRAPQTHWAICGAPN